MRTPVRSMSPIARIVEPAGTRYPARPVGSGEKSRSFCTGVAVNTMSTAPDLAAATSAFLGNDGFERYMTIAQARPDRIKLLPCRRRLPIIDVGVPG
jgi:hypothetical protein